MSHCTSLSHSIPSVWRSLVCVAQCEAVTGHDTLAGSKMRMHYRRLTLCHLLGALFDVFVWMNVTAARIVVVLVFGENLWEIVTNSVTIAYCRIRECNSVLTFVCHRWVIFFFFLSFVLLCIGFSLICIIYIYYISIIAIQYTCFRKCIDCFSLQIYHQKWYNITKNGHEKSKD